MKLVAFVLSLCASLAVSAQGYPVRTGKSGRSYASGFLRMPMPSTSTSTTSPAFMNSFGLRP